MVKSKRAQEGYLLIENRFSPATDATADVPAIRGIFESATVTCSHCHRVVVLNPGRTRPKTYCSHCDHYLCDSCAAFPFDCRPLVKVLDRLQEQASRAEAVDPLVTLA